MSYTRKDDAAIDVLAERVEGLCMRHGRDENRHLKMADALTKLAIVEERQTQTIWPKNELSKPWSASKNASDSKSCNAATRKKACANSLLTATNGYRSAWAS